MAKGKGAKRQTTLYKTLQRKLRIKQHEPYKNWGINNSGIRQLKIEQHKPHLKPGMN